MSHGKTSLPAIVGSLMVVLATSSLAGVVDCVPPSADPNFQITDGVADMRTVPTTCIIDGGLEGATALGVFTNEQDLVAGTGFRNSFLRIDNNGNSNVVSKGYNTDMRPIQDGFDSTPGGTGGDPNFTRAVQISELGRFNTTVGGVTDEYFAFVLDINEANANNTNKDKWSLSLGELQFFLADDGLYNDFDVSGNLNKREILSQQGNNITYTDVVDTATKVWDMDLGQLELGGTGTAPFQQDATIELDYGNYSGSGREDLIAWIPTSVFDTHLAANGDDTFLYLYSNFGDPNNEDAGFEEWAFLSGVDGTNVIPEPGTMILLGTGLLGLSGVARRRARPARQNTGT